LIELARYDASNCLRMGVQLSEWKAMTVTEQHAFIDVFNEDTEAMKEGG